MCAELDEHCLEHPGVDISFHVDDGAQAARGRSPDLVASLLARAVRALAERLLRNLGLPTDIAKSCATGSSRECLAAYCRTMGHAVGTVEHTIRKLGYEVVAGKRSRRQVRKARWKKYLKRQQRARQTGTKARGHTRVFYAGILPSLLCAADSGVCLHDDTIRMLRGAAAGLTGSPKGPGPS